MTERKVDFKDWVCLSCEKEDQIPIYLDDIPGLENMLKLCNKLVDDMGSQFNENGTTLQELKELMERHGYR